MSAPAPAFVTMPGDLPEVGRWSEPYRAAPLKSLSLADLLAMEIKPRKMLLSPVIPEKGLQHA